MDATTDNINRILDQSGARIYTLEHELERKDAEIAKLRAALERALAYCDEAQHPTDQYRDDRPELMRVAGAGEQGMTYG